MVTAYGGRAAEQGPADGRAPTGAEPGRLLSVSAAARLLGVSSSSLRAWAAAGRVPHVRTPGGHRRFELDELVRWLAERGGAPPAPQNRMQELVPTRLEAMPATATALAEAEDDVIAVVSILGKLADAGVLLVKAERQSRAEDAGELQAHRDSVWAEVSQLLDDIVDEPRAPPARTAQPAPGGASRSSDARDGVRTTKGAGGQQAARPFCVPSAGAAPGRRPVRDPPQAVTSRTRSSNASTKRSTSASVCVMERVHSSSRPRGR